MKKLGEILRQERLAREIPLKVVAEKLLLKEEVLQALEEDDWASLPEKAYIQGFIKSYAQILNLDSERLLALFRREYDERKYGKKNPVQTRKKRFMFTPNLLVPTALVLGIFVFVIYLIVQYTSVLSAPDLKISSPQDDITTTAGVIEIKGETEADVTVSISGELITVDESGKFSYQYKLDEGRNVIEIIASRKLSPKSRVTRIVRRSQ